LILASNEGHRGLFAGQINGTTGYEKLPHRFACYVNVGLYATGEPDCKPRAQAQLKSKDDSDHAAVGALSHVEALNTA
jgi:hypothetical protein